MATPGRNEGPTPLWDSEADQWLRQTQAAQTDSGSSGLAPSATETDRTLSVIEIKLIVHKTSYYSCIPQKWTVRAAR